MFTGIVEDLGEIEAIEPLGDFARIHVRSATVTDDAQPGDSIAVNGVCLTVTRLAGEPRAPSGFTADVMGETLARSSLASLAPGVKVNLERSVRVQDRLGGHLVQGHVDGVATVLSRSGSGQARYDQPSTGPASGGTGGRLPEGPQQHWDVVRVSLPPELARYVVHKGSVAVDGVSLTVSAIGEDWFEVSLIPETLKRTTLGLRQPGQTVNLEVDVMAKHIEKLISAGGAR